MDDLKRFLGYARDQKTSIVLAFASSILAALFLTVAVGTADDLLQVLDVVATEEIERRKALEQGRSALDAAEVAGQGDSGADDGTRSEFSPFGALEERVDRLFGPLRDYLHEDGLVRVPLFLIVAYMFRGLFGFLAVYGVRRAGLLATAKLRQELYDKAIAQSDDYYRVRTTADTMARINSDLGRLGGLFKSEFAQSMQAIPVIFLMVSFAIYTAPQVSVLCFVMIPIFAFVIAKFGKRIKKAAKRSQLRISRMTEIIEETLIARRIVQVFGATDYESGRFQREQRELVRQELKVARTMASSSPIVEVMSMAFGAGLIIYAGRLITAGSLDPKDVMVSCVALIIAFTNVRRVGKLNNSVQNSLAAAQRVFEVLDAPVAIEDAPGAVKAPPFRGEIVLDGVSYSYGRGPALQGVDLRIAAGETHALVGSSGAGKTTLALLIPRFFDPSEGSVTVDGLDLRKVTVESLRAQIAYVSQETHLFDDSVTANIAYGTPGATEDRIREAARNAHADDFISALPKGYATKLGDRGGKLSVGQRQRIAIARAFLKDAPILLLDEATSALDSESERQVHSALDALVQGRTTLIIAHRLSTVIGADQIHVMDQGQIIESGRHAELLGREGAYARLHALQVRSHESTDEGQNVGKG